MSVVAKDSRYWVYVHTCPNGKRYVGVTKRSPERRWCKGRGYGRDSYFTRAILKYGWDNITHEVFEVDSEEEMYRKEVELISFYHSNDPKYGYNSSLGGEHSNLGCRRSEEFKRKISEIVKGRHTSEETKRKLSEAQKGRQRSEETRRKISDIHKGMHPSEETRRKMSEAHKGRHLSEETRRKMSESAKRRKL